jgi:hypothetical protein
MIKCQSCHTSEEVAPTRYSKFLIELEYLCSYCNKQWETFVDSFLAQEKNETWVRCNIYASPFTFLQDRRAPQPSAIEVGPNTRNNNEGS